MDRSDLYLRIVDAFARYQGNIAFILEAKAAEAEKSRNWVCEYLQEGAFHDQKERFKQSYAVHERIIEIIDGVVKMENGFARNLKLLLGQNEESNDADSGGLFGNWFGAGDKSK